MNADFLKFDFHGQQFDAVIMNPPFKGQGFTWKKFVTKAQELLTNDGVLISVIPTMGWHNGETIFDNVMFESTSIVGKVALLDKHSKMKTFVNKVHSSENKHLASSFDKRKSIDLSGKLVCDIYGSLIEVNDDMSNIPNIVMIVNVPVADKSQLQQSLTNYYNVIKQEVKQGNRVRPMLDVKDVRKVLSSMENV